MPRMVAFSPMNCMPSAASSVRKVRANSPAVKNSTREVTPYWTPITLWSKEMLRYFAQPLYRGASGCSGVSCPLAHFHQSLTAPTPTIKRSRPKDCPHRPGSIRIPDWQTHHQADAADNRHPNQRAQHKVNRTTHKTDGEKSRAFIFVHCTSLMLILLDPVALSQALNKPDNVINLTVRHICSHIRRHQVLETFDDIGGWITN